MNKIIFILIFAGLLFSCDETHVETRSIYVCNCEEQKQASTFVKESIKNSNNMSDEEMEDVISQLERTSIRLNCPQKRKKVNISSSSGYIIDVVDLKEGETAYPEY